MAKPSDTADCRRMAEHYAACAKQMSDPIDRAALLEMEKNQITAISIMAARFTGLIMWRARMR
jgi:hypothetical protein